MCSEFLRPEKSIDLSRFWTREPWISRRARYPETTEADLLHDWRKAYMDSKLQEKNAQFERQKKHFNNQLAHN